MVQRGLKCDMDKPVWGLSGTDTYSMDLPGWSISDADWLTGFEGVFLYGRKGKNKAEGLLQVCRELAAASLAVVGLSGSASLSLTPTGTGGKWAQLSAMRAQGGQVGQRRVRLQGAATGCGTDSKPQEE